MLSKFVIKLYLIGVALAFIIPCLIFLYINTPKIIEQAEIPKYKKTLQLENLNCHKREKIITLEGHVIIDEDFTDKRSFTAINVYARNKNDHIYLQLPVRTNNHIDNYPSIIGSSFSTSLYLYKAWLNTELPIEFVIIKKDISDQLIGNIYVCR